MILPLPLDVFVHILSFLPPSRSHEDDSSAKCLASCAQANTLLREAATLPTLWEPHYRARYLHCDKEDEQKRKEKHAGNWRLMYIVRRQQDNCALRLLDQIVAQRARRYVLASSLARMGLDVWDVLELETQCNVPAAFKAEGSEELADQTLIPHALTRRYWAQSMLEVISKAYAIELWGRLIAPGGEDAVSFEATFSALSCFFGNSPIEVSIVLDQLAADCKRYLASKDIASDSLDSRYNLADRCLCICEFMHEEGFGPAEPQRFFEILNQFPHAYLSTNKRTIPISLVHVFVAIARRLDIAASPVDFPGRVLVHVQSANPDVNDLYVDVFGFDSKPILSIQDDIPVMLLRMGVPPQSVTRYLAPCGGAPMLLRAARNILSASREAPDYTHTVAQASLYTAFCVHLLLTNEVRLVSYMISNVELRPLDCSTFLSDNLAPHLKLNGQELLLKSCRQSLAREEQTASVIKRRSTPDRPVKFFVGLVFEHCRFGYLACITGWDEICTASDEWIVQMDVDALSRGRKQPFYSVVSLDGSQRYVAEENIKPAILTKPMVLELFRSVPTLPMYFEDVDLQHGRGRMLLSPETQHAYPDDDEIGLLWSQTGRFCEQTDTLRLECSSSSTTILD